MEFLHCERPRFVRGPKPPLMCPEKHVGEYPSYTCDGRHPGTRVVFQKMQRHEYGEQALRRHHHDGQDAHEFQRECKFNRVHIALVMPGARLLHCERYQTKAVKRADAGGVKPAAVRRPFRSLHDKHSEDAHAREKYPDCVCIHVATRIEFIYVVFHYDVRDLLKSPFLAAVLFHCC